VDNITHSIVGFWMGETLHRAQAPLETPQAQERRRTLYIGASIVANNLPDLDLILTPLLPAPLGYLMHHRGHTHTLFWGSIQILMVYFLFRFLPWFKDHLSLSRSSRRGLWILSLMGFLVHLILDGMNSYGVHPFHPFWNHWIYGDLVFIIEPVFWASLGTSVALSLKTTLRGIILISALFAIPLVASLIGLLHWASLLMLVIIAVLVAGDYLKWRSLLRAHLAAAVVLIAFIGLLAGLQSRASWLTELEYKARFPKAEMLDVVLSPLPANPICWNYLAVAASANDEGQYRLERGSVALFPGLMNAETCPNMNRIRGENKTEAEFVSPVIRAQTSREFSIDELSRRRSANCWYDVWLRFARAPGLLPDGATDWRFLNQGEDNFSTLNEKSLEPTPCSSLSLKWVPGWERPRQDLLQRSSLRD